MEKLNLFSRKEITDTMTKEDEPKEIQRLELGSETDIVVKETQENPTILNILNSLNHDCFPAQILIEKNGKIVEDFKKWIPDGIYFRKEKKVEKNKDNDNDSDE